MADPYSAIALHLPNDVAIGGALITMVEPHAGHEYDYNRWYEDDLLHLVLLDDEGSRRGRRALVLPRDGRGAHATWPRVHAS